MRKNINLLLSGVLSIGISSVFGADLEHQRESAAGRGAHLTQVFSSFSASLNRKFGVTFPKDDSMSAVLRFKTGLLRHLKKQRAVESAIAELYEAGLEADEERVTDPLAMLRAITSFEGDDDHDAEMNGGEYDADEFDDVVHPRTEVMIRGDIHRTEGELHQLEGYARSLNEEIAQIDVKTMQELIAAKNAELDTYRPIVALKGTPFRDRRGGEEKVAYAAHKIDYEAKINNAEREIAKITEDVRALRKVLIGLERMHGSKVRELEGVAQRQAELGELHAQLRRELVAKTAGGAGDDE